MARTAEIIAFYEETIKSKDKIIQDFSLELAVRASECDEEDRAALLQAEARYAIPVALPA